MQTGGLTAHGDRSRGDTSGPESRKPLQGRRQKWRVFHAANVPFGFGGAHGSSRWLRYLQSDETVVHAATFAPELARELGAVPDRQGPLIVFRTMTARDLAADAADTAHPLLVHAELAREAAVMLMEKVVLGPR